MTTIAYRKGMLAGDSCWTDGDTVVALQTKVVRLKSGALYGACGGSDDRELVALLQDVKSGAGVPARGVLAAIGGSVLALVVFPDGEIWRIETGDDETAPEAMPVHDNFAAVGSGARFALGAMEAGADAETAVRIACRRDRNSREPIWCVTL